MIDTTTAAKLLDFGARIGSGQRAQEQLEGAVAIHNILEEHGVAYLADEVGMGKTYVALGALALFRHFRPDFRVMIIAPRENIQAKWIKELRNFVAHNVRFCDMRVKTLNGRPVRPHVECGNLLDLVREITLDAERDFFLRLTSFSLPVAGREAVDPEAARRLRDELRRYLPWIRDEVFDLRNKQEFKDNVARALCCALPPLDLVIVDEGHNLKHGFGQNASARNRVLALTMGHPDAGARQILFPCYGPRARRVLFLSATPVEETYRQLWNQLEVFGVSQPYEGLVQDDVAEDDKKSLAAQFLIRRVTSLRVGEKEHTKNLYRREWRRGGVHVHDDPIRIDNARQRLVVALVQKKVSELLGHERFNTSFQIGMLASFESFLETSKLKREDMDVTNFDDSDQTDDALEKEGIDVADVNRLARSYRHKFGCEMPHPKMDALVDSLATSWKSGRKSLIFVRRVASVKELKKKLDERYDQWLMERLLSDTQSPLHDRLKELFEQYATEKHEADAKSRYQTPGQNGRTPDDVDRGGYDTFFAWFFRGEGPKGVISGANIQQRFIQRGAAYATFFEDNYAADILKCRPGEVQKRLSESLAVSEESLRAGLRDRSSRFLSRAKRHARADRFEAVQASAVEWLKDIVGPYQESARICWHERFESSIQTYHAAQAPDIGNWLELASFFTEIRERPALCARLWPQSSKTDHLQAFRERELRRQLLASAARLGHGLIDLYVMTVNRLGSLEHRAQETADDEESVKTGRIHEYLHLLESQMNVPLAQRNWNAFDELEEIATNFDLILDVNVPDARHEPLSETARVFGQLLRQQQPVGGMSGQVNQTLVRQFRMPGYPLVLVTTDLLQEGEDLHTFCSAVHHYGISWTPSSMEQRIGRIDRVRSQTDRRLSTLQSGELSGDDMLQVYFPHLEDTVEVLQVQRVLERMNVFLRLMHEGLTTSGREERTINADKEFIRARRVVPQILERLQSAFPVRANHLSGMVKSLAVTSVMSETLSAQFASLTRVSMPGIDVSWEPQLAPGQLMGTAKLCGRVQPFTLLLESLGTHPIVRCISPVGCIGPEEDPEAITDSTARYSAKIGAILTSQDRTYDLTVEGDVFLTGATETDATRVALLIKRIVDRADRMEIEHLPGTDEILATFRDDMMGEGTDGR